MNRFLSYLWRIPVALVLVFLLAICVTSVSPIYRFDSPRPFSGPDIFNPYADIDSSAGWKRANFHTHTRVNSIFNECDFYPEEIYRRYMEFGYDIVAFSNHNRLTTNPIDTSLQVNVYEHGYNFFLFHKLVFGSGRVNHFDHILPLLVSQKQWQLDLLSRDSDFIQLNHPLRSTGTSRKMMNELTSYRIMELDSGISTEQEYWDWALSAGHYSFGLANDDLHYPDRSDRIAVRCNWVNTPSARYQDIKEALLKGRYYSMRVPDFGNGDWEMKIEQNRHLPRIEEIGAVGDSLYIRLSSPAKEIKLTGDNHSIIGCTVFNDNFGCRMRKDDSYARFTVYFDNGVVIYSNPFARYDSSVSESPYVRAEHRVDIPMTVLFNLLVLVLAGGLVWLLAILFITVTKQKTVI